MNVGKNQPLFPHNPDMALYISLHGTMYSAFTIPHDDLMWVNYIFAWAHGDVPCNNQYLTFTEAHTDDSSEEDHVDIALIGIIVAILLVMLIMLILVLICCVYKRRKHRRTPANVQQQVLPEAAVAYENPGRYMCNMTYMLYKRKIWMPSRLFVKDIFSVRGGIIVYPWLRVSVLAMLW